MVAQARLISSVGLACRDKGDFSRALKLQQFAVELDPNCFQAQINLGVALQDLNQIQQAIEVFKVAISLAPSQETQNLCVAKINHCMAELRLNPSYELFRKFLIRWDIKGWPQQPYQIQTQHWLHSDDFRFDQLIVMPDQGYGDNLMSLPAIAWLGQMAPKKLKVLVRPPMLRFFQVALKSYEIEVVDKFKGNPTGWLTGLDILGVFSQAFNQYSKERLQIEINLKDYFQKQSFNNITPNNLAVGLCWRGNPSYDLDKWRTLPVQDFLVTLENFKSKVHLATLLIDLKDDEIKAIKHKDLRWSSPQGDFLDTAMLMMQTSFVWSADTACTHLAGLCGVPACVAVSLPGDWRWPNESGPSKWYPKVKVFRQTQLNDWTPYVTHFKNWLNEALKVQQF
jgi:tetratricopeptide (TPR) repeat protein